MEITGETLDIILSALAEHGPPGTSISLRSPRMANSTQRSHCPKLCRLLVTA